MSTETSGELKLIKPEISDNIDQTINNDLPANFEKIDTEVTKRVKKATGKDLSTNDYTNEEKQKLLHIAANATKVADSTTNGNILINDQELSVYDDTDVLLELDTLATEVIDHKSATMPHEFTSLKTGKKYRYGRQVSADGIPQIISEEVV